MKRLLFILLFFLTFTATVFKVSAQDAKVIIPQPLVGQFYPIYNDWLVPTNEVPFKDINFIFIAFAHVYSNNEKPASIILSYENARKEKTKLTAGDFDSDRKVERRDRLKRYCNKEWGHCENFEERKR